MNTFITFSIITILVGVASSVVTFKLWEKESFSNYDRYDKHIENLNKAISKLEKENAKLKAELKTAKTRVNPAQELFLDIPSRRSAYTPKNSDFFEVW